MSNPTDKPRPEFLTLAESCGAYLTGKPNGSEAITVVFTIEAWRKFDAALSPAPEPANIRERWNIERDGEALLVCFNDHEKSQGCNYQRFVPETLLTSTAVAVRYDFDGYGWKYIDNGSGSDWMTRHPDGELLYDRPAPMDKLPE